ncbi:inosine-5'-monophosphate dehydrogenase [Synergistales bacterium]|nr:inosine-5'-monophosphate dehydrogenase [Synergistales bacterium]
MSDATIYADCGYEGKFVDYRGFTFDDVLLVPGYSEVLPSQVSTETYLTPGIRMHTPICSAAMDTVTEAQLAIALAREGGIGILHRNLTIEAQVREVDKVKRSESGVIVDPFYLYPENDVSEAMELMAHYHISGVPIVNSELRLIGIITNRDLRFVTNYDQPIDNVMTKDGIVTAPVGTDIETAKSILSARKVEKLPIVDADNKLMGLITIKDIQKAKDFPNATKDANGRLRVGAGLGTGSDTMERLDALMERGIDVVVVDTAHGHSLSVMDMIKTIRNKYPELQIIGGNIATADAARDLIAAGANAVKVGMGPGSICTTRIIAGIGVPQIAAVMNVAGVAHKMGGMVIADGGIRYSGDIVKALAAGADSVMIGSLFAGTDESPGESVIYKGRSFKSYRGMGSLGAMKGGSTKDRYFQEGAADDKLVPEGIEGLVPHKGPISGIVFQMVGGIRSGMGYVGASTIGDLHKNAKFVQVTSASMKESHPHDVVITKESPNYAVE